MPKAPIRPESSGAVDITLADGTLIVADADIASLSTYILLEQEDWFEKEIAFVRRFLRPGMAAIDIGANIGIYSLVMARLVGPGGRIHACEPAERPRARLARACALNGLANVTILPVAVSDHAGRGRLDAAGVSEIAALREGTDGTEVALTTLDHLDAGLNWPAPDFVKIDAEGAEAAILRGGSGFFVRHSPLVMIEIKTDTVIDDRLVRQVTGLGYDLYRLLPEDRVLVSYKPGEALDPYELNLFACKTERAAQLEAAGLLSRDPSVQAVIAVTPTDAVARLRDQPFASGFPALFACSIEPAYGEALAAYAAWRDVAAPLTTRYAALRHGYNRLLGLAQTSPRPAYLLTLSRLAWAAGQRHAVMAILERLLAIRPINLDQPFLPPCPRFDAVASETDPAAWLSAAIGEQYERLRAYSSLFAPTWEGLPGLCRNPYAAIEMDRRLMLRGLVTGQPVAVPARLLHEAADHRNAVWWRQISGAGSFQR